MNIEDLHHRKDELGREYRRTPRGDPWRADIVEEFKGLIDRVNELKKYRGIGGWNFRFRFCEFFIKELLCLIDTGSFKQGQTFVDDIEISLEQYDRFKQVSSWVGWTIIAISAVLFIVIEY